MRMGSHHKSKSKQLLKKANTGRKHKPETIAELKKKGTGRKPRIETRQKMSKTRRAGMVVKRRTAWWLEFDPASKKFNLHQYYRRVRVYEKSKDIETLEKV